MLFSNPAHKTPPSYHPISSNLWHSLFFLLLLLSLAACEKEPKPAELTLSQQEFRLNDNILSGNFVVSNSGDRQFKWSAEPESELITLSTNWGKSLTGPDTVNFELYPLIAPGSYDFWIRVTNDKDQHKSVRLYTEIAERIGIYPGEGIYKIPLGTKYKYIKKLLGNSDYLRYYTNYNETEYGHEFFYDTYGIGFFTVNGNSVQIDESEICSDIYIYPPYAEVSSNNISANSTLEDVMSLCGKPDAIEQIVTPEAMRFYVHIYYAKGIAFYYFHNRNDEIYLIDIFKPFNPESQGSARANSFSQLPGRLLNLSKNR